MKPVLASINHISDQELELLLHGVWSVKEVEDIKEMLNNIDMRGITRVTIDGADVQKIDISSLWTLVAFARKARQKNIEIVARNIQERDRRILEIVNKLENPSSAPQKSSAEIDAFFTHLGEYSLLVLDGLSSMLEFFGKLCLVSLATIRQPRRLRLRSVIYHINEIGLRAIPIVSLLAFLISIVLGYQGALQLNKFGAGIFTVDFVAIALLREMGIIVTSIIVAGRSGSAFAAEIGVMKVNRETDALRTFGLDPFELLVLPRILAIIVALPILTFIADVVGLYGDMFVSGFQLNISQEQFLGRVREAVSAQTFLIGLVKAPVFALLIGMTGCLQGMQVKESAEEVGQRTTAAVVQSIFLIILFDAAFSVLFSWMGI